MSKAIDHRSKAMKLMDYVERHYQPIRNGEHLYEIIYHMRDNEFERATGLEQEQRTMLEQLKAEIEKEKGYVDGTYAVAWSVVVEVIDKKLAEGIKKPGAQEQ